MRDAHNQKLPLLLRVNYSKQEGKMTMTTLEWLITNSSHMLPQMNIAQLSEFLEDLRSYKPVKDHELRPAWDKFLAATVAALELRQNLAALDAELARLKENA